jgi:hypothetical protein
VTAAADAATTTTPSAGSGALGGAHTALEAHLEGFHPGLVAYIGAIHELGVDKLDDLSEQDEESIESLNVKKLHRAKFLPKACGK